MDKYFFTVASLPHLFITLDSFPTVSEFLESCESHLSPSDMSVLKKANILNYTELETGNSVLNQWNKWEYSLRIEIAKIRANKLNRSDEYENIESEINLSQSLKNLTTIDSPLDAEMEIIKLRWEFLDDLELMHYFDIEKIIIYYLRLQILERKKNMERKKGMEAYQKLYTKITEPLDVDSVAV